MDKLNKLKNKLKEIKDKNNDEYKKLLNKFKKVRNRINKKNRDNQENRYKIRNENNEEELDEEVEYEYEFDENIELKEIFGDAYKYLSGLYHSNNSDNNIDDEIIENIPEETSMNIIMEEEEENNDEILKRRRILRELKRNNNGIIGKLTIKELKEKTNHPELVEIWDTTADDPELLVFLKGYQGSVKVPQHWNSKRRYLQGKKGMERPPYKLPSFIEETKIAEIRASLLEEESKLTIKQKQRRKIRPKLNRMDIDYQVLHDAFFLYSVKPILTQFGDLYYEGKEFEFKYKNITPGKLSQRLKDALGMQPNWPPPWLIKMQKYGPPPSYPYLRVPGVNSQIPKGCEFGFRPGDWGKPPIDDNGKPIWGLLPPVDEEINNYQNKFGIDHINTNNSHNYWGEIEDDIEIQNNSTEDTNDDNYNDIHLNEADNINDNMSQLIKPNIPKIVNPFLFNNNDNNSRLIREGSNNIPKYDEYNNKSLYTVIEQNEVNIDNKSIFPSTYYYNIK